jgi:hypothetical protein
MTQAKATAWTQADANGFYWWRYDKDAAPEPVEVRDGMFYCIADTDPTSTSVGEFLGPVTPELSNERDALLGEVAQLREALESMKQAAEFALTTPGMIRGRDQLKNAVETTGVFAPPSLVKER